MTETTETETETGEVEVRSEASKIRFEATLAREEAVAYFEALITGLKKGSIHITQGDDHISLHPQAQIEVNVKAQRKEGRERISFEMGWRQPTNTDLTITSE